MREVLNIDVVTDEYFDVTGSELGACIITFHGESNCENFKGRILPGGVDTQIRLATGERTLSARYILEGRDFEDKPCRIFIENNGMFMKDGTIATRPVIVTDSKALAKVFSGELTGTVTDTEGGVRIAFYSNI